MILERIVTMLFMLFACHFLGDYFLRTDTLWLRKVVNFWYMFVHCVLYSVPFAAVYGINWKIAVLIGTHFIIDTLHERWRMFNEAVDQVLHIVIILGLYLLPVVVKVV